MPIVRRVHWCDRYLISAVPAKLILGRQLTVLSIRAGGSMSIYGISMIKLDATVDEVAEAKVHRFSKDKDGNIGLDEGKAMAYHEVASLIVGGDTVYVIVEGDDPGSYRHTDKVRVKAGQREYLESFGRDGATTGALMALPAYR